MATAPVIELPLGENIHAFTTGRGEVDNDNPYSAFNVCHYTGDAPVHVTRCRQLLAETLDMPESHIVIPRQTHSTNVVTISTIPVAPIDDTDALVTTLSGITIGINTADCVPILLADGANHVIGAAHAGWKGTARRIAAATVGEMIKAGADPSCIKVIMGPCICAACFEVGDEVAETFRQSGFDLSRISFRNRVTGKIHIDLAQANRIVLMEAGIPPENISLPISCTRCRPDKYFSARRLGIHSGRIFTGLSLKR